jgi:hypothetical protein
MWADFKFPPINLWNIPPSPEMLEVNNWLFASIYDKDLFEDDNTRSSTQLY